MNRKCDKTDDLQKYLLDHIPITSALGVCVDSVSPDSVVLSAPLLNNINHKMTVFGGSLHAVATLACWSLLHVNLEKSEESHHQIVIAASEIQYLHPVNADFQASCNMPDIQVWKRFVKTLEKHGKARIKLSAHILHQSKLCVDYFGTFVAIKNKF
jgi:thioesterase domain-containing protein